MKTIKATITSNDHIGKIRQNRKEDHFTGSYSLINSDLQEIAVIRFYWTASRCYSCLWVHDSKHHIHVSGGGYAGGYGYCKASAAAAEAIADAGINLSSNISGRGTGMIEAAMYAIGKALGYRKLNIIHANA